MACSLRLLMAVAIAMACAPSSASSQTVADLSYEIEAVVDFANGEIGGRAVIEVPYGLLWSPSEARLDLRSAGDDSIGSLLSIESVSAKGDVELLESPEGHVRVMLPNPVNPGDAVRLEVGFTSRFNDYYETLGYYSFWSHEPGAYWYPDVVGPDGHRASFSDFQVTLDYPETYTVLTTGIQTGSGESEAGRTQATFHAPHVEGFSVHLAEGYELMKLEGEGYSVVGLLPADEPDAFRSAVALTAEAVEWYRQAYGFFPVQQIGIIPGPRRWSGGYPLSNVFMIHRGNLSADFLRWITAHELGHYYWGLYVLSVSGDRLDWLNLANGIWADHLYLARTSGRTVPEVLRDWGAGDMLVDYLEAMLENREQRLGISWEDEEELGFDYNSLIRHGKATVGVYLQAQRLGDDRFLEVQRQLLNDYRFKPLPVSDFSDRLEKAGATGAGEFFEKWARGDARIEFILDDVESERVEDGWVHRVQVSQAGTISYDLEVELIDANGDRVVRVLAADGFAEDGVEVLEVMLPAQLADVRLDPSGLLPMWNSSNAGIKKAFLFAMFRADLTEPFLVLASDYLRIHPSDENVLLLYVLRLFGVRRYEQIVAAMDRADRDSAEACATRYSCWTTILQARSLNALGRSVEADDLLSAIQESATSHGVQRLWDEAHSELQAAVGQGSGQ